MGGDNFPSLKAGQMLSILLREPLCYYIESQEGSHRKLKSSNGYIPLLFAFHDGKTLAPGLVRMILVNVVGLPKEEALRLAGSG